MALLAGILVGNVVEAYGAAQPIIGGGHTPRFAVTLLTAIGCALAFATVVGGTVLADASAELVGTAQAVAAGAVLAVVSIAIIPHAFSEVNRLRGGGHRRRVHRRLPAQLTVGSEDWTRARDRDRRSVRLLDASGGLIP